MHSRLLPVAAIAVSVLAGCSSPSSSANDPGGSTPTRGNADSTQARAARAKGPKFEVIKTDYGRILGDGQGKALYLFTADDGRTTNCSGSCASVWPPYLVKKAPAALSGAKPGLVGTTRRVRGKQQATYAGHPLYYYEGDRSPGEVNCQAALEFGGYWYVLRGSGRAVH